MDINIPTYISYIINNTMISKIFNKQNSTLINKLEFSKNHTKKWRHKTDWYSNGKRNECEKFKLV